MAINSVMFCSVVLELVLRSETSSRISDGVHGLKHQGDLFLAHTVSGQFLRIDFNVDYIWHENWVKDKCQALADEVFAQKANVIEPYGNITAAAS